MSRQQRALTALTILAVLAVLGGSATYIARTAEQADKTAPANSWGKIKAEKETSSPGARHTGLGKQLLPIPKGYILGPDIEGYGNDTELGSSQARAVLHEPIRGLSGAQRRAAREAVNRLQVGGIALRSYADPAQVLVAEMQLTEAKNDKAVRDLAESRKELADVLGIFPKGPKVPGYKNASCYLLPKDLYGDLDVMYCTAYQDDLMVTMTAYGPHKLAKAEAVDLLKKQLDHIAGPGESV